MHAAMAAMLGLIIRETTNGKKSCVKWMWEIAKYFHESVVF
jgi:hypothetical protein